MAQNVGTKSAFTPWFYSFPLLFYFICIEIELIFILCLGKYYRSILAEITKKVLSDLEASKCQVLSIKMLENMKCQIYFFLVFFLLIHSILMFIIVGHLIYFTRESYSCRYHSIPCYNFLHHNLLRHLNLSQIVRLSQFHVHI